MDLLEITSEYKFKKGGAVFHASEGDRIKVKLSNSNVVEGILTKVSCMAGCFDLDTDNGIVTIDCENVVDIIPV